MKKALFVYCIISSFSIFASVKYAVLEEENIELSFDDKTVTKQFMTEVPKISVPVKYHSALGVTQKFTIAAAPKTNAHDFKKLVALRVGSQRFDLITLCKENLCAKKDFTVAQLQKDAKTVIEVLAQEYESKDMGKVAQSK